MGLELVAIGVLLVGTVLSATLIHPARWAAHQFGIIDVPGDRKIHLHPTPRSGGIAVFSAFTLVVLAGYAIATLTHSGALFAGGVMQASLAPLSSVHLVQGKLVAVLVGATLAFATGLLDDILGRRFPVWMKALGQILAAVVLVAGGVRTSFLPYEWMNYAITIVWIVGITNAFNLLDNMDGLSAGVAFVASGVLLINAWMLGEILVSLILVAFMGSLLGFLLYNFNPASVFLGDCGSLFIGYVMAAITLLERYVSHASGTLFPVLMPVLVLAIPITDTLTVTVIRLRERRPIYVGDERHLSHRLVQLGFSQRSAVLFIYLATFCLGLGAASLTDASGERSLLILLQAVGFISLLLLLMFIRRNEARSKDA